jgi:putative glutamine amidotransferase
MKKIIIGVTDCSKYEKYANWIKAYSLDIEAIKLSEKINNLEAASQCHGLLFTGGEDVHPRFYNKPEYLKYCHKDDISEARDVFEMKLMEYSEANAVPVLGICRGLQIYNVFRGGTLIPDIPSWEKDKINHAKTKEGLDSYHSSIVTPDSWLNKITGLLHGDTNSNHHQSADIIGDGLVTSAVTEDGIVEAIDQKNPEGKSFLCLVQWHPERMKDQHSPFVQNIREAFVNASQKLV